MTLTQMRRALTPSILGAAAMLVASTCAATTVTVRIDQPVLNTVSKTTYGSGFDYLAPDIRTFFTDGVGNQANPINKGAGYAQKSYDMLAMAGTGLNFGLIRYPGGDRSFLFRWDLPCGSIGRFENEAPGQCVEYFIPEDIERHISAVSVPAGKTWRAPLGAQVMYQVNTIFYWTPGEPSGTEARAIYKRTKNASGQWIPTRDANGKFILDDAALAEAADYAAKWVLETRKVVNGVPKIPRAQQPVYWEIGNEDWARATPKQYAKIFKVFTDKMVAANGGTEGDALRAPIRFIAQAATVNGNYTPPPEHPDWLGILQNEGEDWIQTFASELYNLRADLSRVHAVSLHPYVSGDRAMALQTRAYNMFGKTDALYRGNDDVNMMVANIRALCNFGTNAICSKPDKWKVISTEYNVKDADTDLNGAPIPVQNKAHALVLADWTANLLTLGFDRVLPFDLSFGKEFALFQYRLDSSGLTVPNPRWMPSGAAVQRLTNHFLGAVHTAENDASHISYTDGAQLKSVKALGSYAVYNTEKKLLNILLVNRSTSSQSVQIKMKSPTLAFRSGAPYFKTEFAPGKTLDANNFITEDVKWGSVVPSTSVIPANNCAGTPRTCTLPEPVVLPGNSMMHVHVFLN